MKANTIRAAVAAVCVATAALPSYADSITVAPVVDANRLETAFNLTLDVSATRYLCAAWAETDKGANYTAWTNDNFEVLGEVDSSTTSWTFDAPKGWGDGIRALRFFLVEKESRPYDSRVEWIESTGQEWINTGYIGACPDVYDMHFLMKAVGGYPIAAFGGSSAGSNQRWSIIQLTTTSMYQIGFNAKWSNTHDATRNSIPAPEANVELFVRTSMASGSQTLSVSHRGFDDMDLAVATSLSESGAAANTTAPVYLFARNCGNTSTDITKGGTTDGPCSMRLFSCRIAHNGTTVRNFMPCMKDGKAGLYDTVLGNFHGNVSGKGAFVAGPVVEEQLLGAVAAFSATAAPVLPVAKISQVSATASSIGFSAALVHSAAAVSATFAYGNSPYALGEAVEVSANWAQGGTVSFSATGLSEGVRQYGVLTLLQDGSAVRAYGFWFVTRGAERRTVAVGSIREGGVIEAVVSKAAAGTTNVLFVAYGSTQGGDTPESWATCERVCLVGPDAETVAVTVPGWREVTTAARFFLAECNALPYDAQVEWIASQGDQWIDTEYTGSRTDEYEIAFRSDNASGQFLLGSYGTSGANSSRYSVVQQSVLDDGLKLCCGYNAWYGYTTAYIRRGADSVVNIEFGTSSIVWKWGLLGKPLSTVFTKNDSVAAAAPASNKPLYLFARNCGGSSVDGKSKARLYYCTIRHDGELVRDFIPVVKDGVAGLYDRKNGKCHWNKGSGAFRYGPEIPESGFEVGGVAAMSDAVSLQAEHRTVSLDEVIAGSNGEVFACRLGFANGAAGDEPSRLVFAYGAEDGGAELSAWDGAIVAADIAPGDTSFIYWMPDAIPSGTFHYRFFLVAPGDGLPGASGVGYIQSTGSEWINTGWIANYDDDYDIVFRSLVEPSSNFILLGAANANTTSERMNFVQAYNGKYTFLFDGYKNATTGSTGVAPVKDRDMHFAVKFHKGEQSLSLATLGESLVKKVTINATAAPKNKTAPLYLFARNLNKNGVDNKATARLYSCTIDRDGVRARDFTPCVKNDAVGLYDRTTGCFYGNGSGSGAFIAGDEAGGVAAVYSCTASVGGTGVANGGGSTAGVVSVSSSGARVTATASVANLGLGDTFPYFEWWVEGGDVTNSLAFAATSADDGAETREYSTTFDAGPVWGEAVHCRFAVSNVYENAATGEEFDWRHAAEASIEIVDDATYTWQAVDGDWNGDWTDAAHWASSRPGNCIGYPTAASSAAVPAGADAVITMPGGTNELNWLDINAKGMSVVFRNASGRAALKPAGLGYGDSSGTSWNGQSVALDGVTLLKASPDYPLSVPNGAVFALRGAAAFNSTKLDMINPENTGYTGRVEIGAGARWPETGEISQLRLGGDGVMHVEGTLNVAEFKIGQYGNWGGGTLEIGGTNPVVNVSKLLRCWNGNTYVNPSYVTFDIPAESWAAAPLRGGAAADPLAGSAADSASVAAKMIISVPGDAAIIAARKGHRTPFRVPLISWPTGITVDRCELANDNPKHIRYAWTYGGTDSEVDDGNPPTGLAAYITGSGGMMLIVR